MFVKTEKFFGQFCGYTQSLSFLRNWETAVAEASTYLRRGIPIWYHLMSLMTVRKNILSSFINLWLSIFNSYSWFHWGWVQLFCGLWRTCTPTNLSHKRFSGDDRNRFMTTHPLSFLSTFTHAWKYLN